MCAIVDANVAHEVFGENAPPAGARFLDWIDNGNGRLVAGGLLMSELERSSPDFREWVAEAQNSGRILEVKADKVENKTETLREAGVCRSNDHHVIALAQVSRARLLYSNDRALQRDFKDKRLIDNPRGRVYSTLVDQEFSDSHKRLLGRLDLCASAG